MELTSKQEQGLKIAIDRYKNHERYTCISGYAEIINFTSVDLPVPA